MHLNILFTLLVALFLPLQILATTHLLPRQTSTPTPTSTSEASIPCDALGPSASGSCNPDPALLSWNSGNTPVPVTTIIFTLPTTTATIVLPEAMVSSLESDFAFGTSSIGSAAHSNLSAVRSAASSLSTSTAECVNSQITAGVHSVFTSVESRISSLEGTTSAMATPTTKGDASQGSRAGSMMVLLGAVTVVMGLL